ncbi:hypothetical protein L0F63_003582 [Massospora cicadina]|nr:hypothetical protein L0F63_003582 [Massospora cicadina]
MHSKNEVALHVGIALIAFVGGFLAVWFLKLGVVILGAVLGASVSTIFLSLGLFDAKESSTIIFIVSALAFAALAYLLSDTIIIVATAVTGALIFMVGLDFLTKKGFADYVISIRLGKELTPLANTFSPSSAPSS